MNAGFSPVEFWEQTPRSFVAIMEGAAHAAKRRQDELISHAWHTAAFSGAAQAGKLKRLERYLKPERESQTPEQMLDALKTLQKMGAPMTITEVN